MIKELLEEAFAKAQLLTGRDSINARSEYLATFITEDLKFSINSKSIYRYYKGETIPKKEVLDALAVFLEYRDYESFVVRNRNEKGIKQSKPGKKIGKRTGIGTIMGSLAMISMIVVIFFSSMDNKQECIVWVEDHYESVRCSGDRFEKPYSAELLNNFKKVEVSSESSFFKGGKPIIWYDKSDKKLEFFTAPGIHPTNGKTLKPITHYMIRKYIKGQEQ